MADKYVTVAGAGTKVGTSWGNAFGLSEWLTDMSTASAAGDIYWVEEGTYTFTASFSSPRDGSYGNHIAVIGVQAGTTNTPPVYSDFAFGADRPLIAQGIYRFTVDLYWAFSNLRFTSSNDIAISTDDRGFFRNCRVEHTGATRAIYGDSHMVLIDCYITSVSGAGIYTPQGYMRVINSYFKTHNKCIQPGGGGSTLQGNITESATSGIHCEASQNIIAGNTIYGCTNGIYLGTTAENFIYNNTISSCTDGLIASAATNQMWVDYNNYYNNTTDVTNITKGPNALAVDPAFTDAANGDFSLDSASALIGAGLGIQLGVG